MTPRGRAALRAAIASTPALPRALAHADNRRRRPLWDALSAGFAVLEVDVWVLGGQVLVGHTMPHPLRSLRRSYLQPLADLVSENGCVFDDFAQPIMLLLDVKNKPRQARAVIERELGRYPELVSRWQDGQLVPGSVTVVLTGTQMGSTYDAPLRWSGVDGRLRRAELDACPHVVPLRSDCWTELFNWSGNGPMPPDQRARLDDLVRRAHAAGQQVRFWDTPDGPGATRDNLWSTLLAAGVDFLNTDDLTGARDFLLARH